MKENSLVFIYISLKISYVSLQIYSLGCFDEVREECGWFQDTKGFCVNWSGEVELLQKATTYITTVRCRSNGQKWRMADTPSSPAESFIGVSNIGVGVEKKPSW